VVHDLGWTSRRPSSGSTTAATFCPNWHRRHGTLRRQQLQDGALSPPPPPRERFSRPRCLMQNQSHGRRTPNLRRRCTWPNPPSPQIVDHPLPGTSSGALGILVVAKGQGPPTTIMPDWLDPCTTSCPCSSISRACSLSSNAPVCRILPFVETDRPRPLISDAPNESTSVIAML